MTICFCLINKINIHKNYLKIHSQIFIIEREKVLFIQDKKTIIPGVCVHFHPCKDIVPEQHMLFHSKQFHWDIDNLVYTTNYLPFPLQYHTCRGNDTFPRIKVHI